MDKRETSRLDVRGFAGHAKVDNKLRRENDKF